MINGDCYPTRVESDYAILPRVDGICSGDDYWCDSYRENGFYLFKNKISTDEIQTIRDATTNLDKEKAFINYEPNSKTIRSVLGVHNEQYAQGFLDGSFCGEVTDSITGCGSYIHQSRINFKHPGKSTGWTWHSDFETWHAQDGMPRMNCFSFMLPLVKNTISNGCLKVLPGSHKYFISCEKGRTYNPEEHFSDQKVGVPTPEAVSQLKDMCGSQECFVECSAGDVLIFDCNLLHSSGVNQTNEGRGNLFYVVNSRDNLLASPYGFELARPEEMAARNNIKEI